MSFNLLEESKMIFNNELMTKAAAYLDETDSGIHKAIDCIIPAIVAKLVHKASTTSGAGSILLMAQQSYASGILDKPVDFLGNEGGIMLNKAAGLANNLFGDKQEDLCRMVSADLAIKLTSATTLLSMATPVVLALAGKYQADHNLQAAGFTEMVSDQDKHLISTIPPGCDVQSLLPKQEKNRAEPLYGGQDAVEVSVSENDTIKTSGALNWLLTLLLLVLATAAVLYFWKGNNASVAKNDTVTKPGMDSTDQKHDQPKFVKGSVNANGDYVYNQGESMNIQLPNNGGELRVGRYSTEARLVAFLQNPSAPLDTINGNWFELTNVLFKKGAAVIEDSSLAQLKNIVSITKAFNRAQFKIGGYTDNSGPAEFNISLSQKRADAVVAMLKKLGASSNSIVGAKGYGPEHPIGDNTTLEGRAMNRRVAVNVKAKN